MITTFQSSCQDNFLRWVTTRGGLFIVDWYTARGWIWNSAERKPTPFLPRAFSWLRYSEANGYCHSDGQTLNTSFSTKPLLCHACRVLKDGATLSIELPWRRVCRTLTTPSGRSGSRGIAYRRSSGDVLVGTAWYALHTTHSWELVK